MMVFRRRRHLLQLHFPTFPPKPTSSPLLQTPTTHLSNFSSLPPSSTIQTLTTIFTKRLYIQNKAELQALGEQLSPTIVEIVLKGLKSWRIANDFFIWASEQKGYSHNCYTYNTMASIHCKFGKSTRLRFLAIDVVNSRCPMTPGALGFLIRCLGNFGLVDEAVYLFEQMKKLKLCAGNSYSYNCLIEVLARAGRFHLVDARLRQMKGEGWEADKFTLTPILQGYCNARKFKEALVVFNEICEKGWVDEHVFTILMIAFSKWGEVDKAFELIERMEALNMNPNEKTLCSLIHGFTREARVDKALQLFDKMRILAFNPDLPLYSVLIEGLCKTKELDKALYLYTEMKTFGIFPDVYVFKNLISSFCAEEDLVTTNKLLQEGNEELDSQTMVLLYNVVLDGLVKKGLVEKAYLLIQTMMGTKCVGEGEVDDIFNTEITTLPDYASFSVVIDGLCKTLKLDEALNLFRDMMRMGCERNILLYNNVISALCDSNRLEESFELLGEMKRSGFQPTEFTHNCIMGCLCRRENVSEALDLMKEMRVCGHEPWIKHSSGLVKQLCSHGNAAEACDFLTGMAQEGFLPDTIAYSAAIDGLFKIRNVDRALELFQEISTRGHGPDVVAYNIVIDGLWKVGRVLEARHILKEMREKGLLPSVVTYNSMIDGLCKSNDLDQAFHYFKQMAAETRDPTIVTYTTLIDGLCSVERAEEALVLWNEMMENGCIPNRISYMALIHGLCKCSRLDVARVYFNEMKEKDMRPDTYIYVALISCSVSNGDLRLALEILRELVQKEGFPASSDKNYPMIVEALRKLSEGSTTSLDVTNLILEGSIPAICRVSEEGGADGSDPIG